ncbi:MAG: hypothetical protein ACSNEK_04655 [Parachlamydiaceae bacterium]
MNPILSTNSVITNSSQLESEELNSINARLPVEIFFNILSELDTPTLKITRCINRLWNTVSMEVIRKRECSPTVKLCHLLGMQLGEGKDQELKNTLRDLTQDIISVKTARLEGITDLIGQSKETLVTILKKADRAELKRLGVPMLSSAEEIDPEKLLMLKIMVGEDVAALAANCKKIDEIKPDQPLTNQQLTKLVTTAVGALSVGFLNLALEITTKMPSGLEKTFLLKRISKAHLNKCNLKTSLEVALLIESQDECHEWIIKTWLQSNGLGKALKRVNLNEIKEIIPMVPTIRLRSLILNAISEQFISNGELDRALQVGVLITDETIQSLTLASISKEWYEKQGGLKKSLEIAEMIPNESIKFMYVKHYSPTTEM